MLLHLGGHQAVRATGGRKPRPPHPFLPRLHRPRHGRAGLTTSSTAAITTTTREDRLPSPLMAYDAAAAPPPIFWRMAIRHRRAGAGRPTPGRAATKEVNRAGGLRRAARRAALVRPVPVHPVRERRRRDRRLRRLGHLTTGAADVQRPTSEPPRIDVRPNSTRDSWTGLAEHACIAVGIGASHLLPVSSTSSTQTVRCALGNDSNEAKFRK